MFVQYFYIIIWYVYIQNKKYLKITKYKYLNVVHKGDGIVAKELSLPGNRNSYDFPVNYLRRDIGTALCI